MDGSRLHYTHLEDEARVVRQALEVVYRRARRGDLSARQSYALGRAGEFLNLARAELERAERNGDDG
jgi:hypothetical protein